MFVFIEEREKALICFFFLFGARILEQERGVSHSCDYDGMTKFSQIQDPQRAQTPLFLSFLWCVTVQSDSLFLGRFSSQ